MVEADNAGFSEFQEALAGLLWGFLAIEASLGEELVGKADDLFLDGFGKEILMRKWQVLTDNLVEGEACACVSFADTGNGFETFLTHETCTQDAVTDIRFGAKALDTRCIGEEDADVVQHGRLLHQLTVCMEFGVGIDDGERFTGDALAMNNEDVAQRVLLWIVFLDDFVVIHGAKIRKKVKSEE